MTTTASANRVEAPLGNRVEHKEKPPQVALLDRLTSAVQPDVPLIELRGVTKTYQLGETTVHALNQLSISFGAGEFVAISGPSGSGKTTLLNLIGLIDQPNSGQIFLRGQEVKEFDDASSAALRNQYIGFVFQSFNLIPVLSAVENVMLPLQMQGIAKRKAKERATAMLSEVGLADWAGSLPDRMSGGQRQRVAIARALITDPKVVVADEPTANLDSENSLRVMQLMRELNRKHDALFVFSTHDQRILDHVDRVITMRDGRLVEGAHS